MSFKFYFCSLISLIFSFSPLVNAQSSASSFSQTEKTTGLKTEDSFVEKINNDLAGLMGNAETAVPSIKLQPVKSDQDNREYRYLVLPNKLRVLLISDSNLEASAAAINVAVGANQNPADRLGLAHFLEHMLFLGTEKYPLPGEYQQFIAAQGGAHNASTAAENTQFYFTIKHQAFEPALDRFAQFFISPLFNEVYVDRERQAVDAEFSAKLRDDFRREWDVYREMMNPQHPGSKFAVGNNRTLADVNDNFVREDLLDFYQKHYSSEKMTLVLLSNQSLVQLQHLAEQKFSAVPQRDSLAGLVYPPVFIPESLPVSVDIKPEKEIRQLTFSFPVPQSKELLLNKPYDYVAHLLGHENKGSLIYILKNLGWAEKLNVGLTYPSKQDALFQISIQLTPTGVRTKDQIISLLFFVLKEIQSQGLDEWRYLELQTIGENQFRYFEKKSPTETVVTLAQNMQDYPVKDILRGPMMFRKFDEKQLQECFSYLRPDNVLMVLTAPDITPWRLSNVYSVPYSVKKSIPEILSIKPGTRQQFALPQPNPFIPEKLIVKTGSLLNDNPAKTFPELLVDKERTRIWYLQDKLFNRPQSAINLRLIVPPENITAERSAMNYLFASVIRDQLNDLTYFASLSGLEFSITPHSRGIDLRLFGFSNRQSLLLNYVIDALKKPDFSESEFSRMKSELIRNWANEERNMPYQVMISRLPSLLTHPEWSSSQMSRALELVTHAQFVQFSKQFLWDAEIDGLVYGNYLPQEAMKLSAIIEHGLQAHQTGRKVSDSIATIMPESSAKPWLYTQALPHQDKIVALYIQSLSAADADLAKMQLIRQILQPEFFHQLRTEKQMGYVVASISLPIKQLEGSLFIVQSPRFAENEIAEAIDEFLDEGKDLIKGDFDVHKDSLIQKLKEPPRSIREQNSRFWDSILLEDFHFNRRQRLVNSLQKLSAEDVTQYYQQVFLNKNRRLWMSSGDLKNQQGFQSVTEQSPQKSAGMSDL